MSGFRPWTPGAPLAGLPSRRSIHVSFPEVEAAEQLERLARADDAAGMRELLDSGVNPNVVLWAPNSSLLAHCIGNKRYAAAQALLDAGAHPCFPLTHYDEFILQTGHSVDQRLTEISTALSRAAQDRRWDWFTRMLDRVEPDRKVGSDVREMVAENLSEAGLSLLNRNAPVPVLRGWFKAMEEMGAEVSYKILLESPISQVSPSRKLFDVVLECYGFSGSLAHSPPRPKSIQPLHSALEGAVGEALSEQIAMEFYSQGLYKKAPKGRALGWMVQAWVREVAPTGVLLDEHKEKMREWAYSAARLGYAELLEKTLLPILLPISADEQGLLDGLMKEALKSNHHTREVLGVIERRWGEAKVHQSLRRIDEGAGDAWRMWLSRPVLPRSSNTFHMAQVIADAGVSVPQRTSRSFFEDCFSRGVQTATLFEGEGGVRLIDLLREAGADPGQRNLGNETPEDVLAKVDDPANLLGPAKARLKSQRLDEVIQPSTSMTGPKKGPRF